MTTTALPAAVDLRLRAGKSARPARFQDGTMVRLLGDATDRFSGAAVSTTGGTFLVQRPSQAASLDWDVAAGFVTADGWAADVATDETGVYRARFEVAGPTASTVEISFTVGPSALGAADLVEVGVSLPVLTNVAALAGAAAGAAAADGIIAPQVEQVSNDAQASEAARAAIEILKALVGEAAATAITKALEAEASAQKTLGLATQALPMFVDGVPVLYALDDPNGRRPPVMDANGRLLQARPDGTIERPALADETRKETATAIGGVAEQFAMPLVRNGIRVLHGVRADGNRVVPIVAEDGRLVQVLADGSFERVASGTEIAALAGAAAAPAVETVVPMAPLIGGERPWRMRTDPTTGRITEVLTLEGSYFVQGPSGLVRIGATATVIAPSPYDLIPLYGPHLHLLPDRRLPVYPRMLFAERSDAALARVSFASGGYAVAGRDIFEIDPTRCGTTGQISVTRADLSSDSRIQAPLVVRVAAASAKAPRILTIADSITNRGLLTLIDTRLKGLGLNPSWIGTVRASASGSSSASTGLLGEAREGRAWADLVYSILDGEAQPLPPGQEASYLAMSKADQFVYNPFLRAATGSDSASIIRNGQVWDLGFYLSRFGFAAPDILLIGLLENDVTEQSDSIVGPTVADAVGIVLAQARVAAPGMRIGLYASGQSSGPSGDNRWKVRKAAAIRALIGKVLAVNDPLVSVVSAWAHQSPDDGWVLDPATGVTNPATGLVAGTIYDAVHPISPARDQLAEALAAYVAWAA
jgi:hypothetical protein